MLAYVFWHYPRADVPPARYEEALLGFYADLDRDPPPEYEGCATYRASSVPWLGDRPGYEDWCLMKSSAALETLNRAAVRPARWEAHAGASSRMDVGYGGLYYHLSGDAHPLAAERVLWLRRPRGIRYEPVLQQMIAQATGFISAWRKLMVLGPGDEFAILGTSALSLDVPEDWQARAVDRKRLGAP